MHHHGSGISSDDARDFIPGDDGHVPPAFRPGANASRRPRFTILGEETECLSRHRPEAMRDQVNGLTEDGKLKPPLEKVVRQWLRSAVIWNLNQFTTEHRLTAVPVVVSTMTSATGLCCSNAKVNPDVEI